MEKDVKKILAIIIFLILLVLSFLLIKPFISALLFAAIFAYMLHPIHTKFVKLIKNKSLSAGIITFIFIAVLAVLLWFVAQIAIREAFNLYLEIQKVDLSTTINSLLSNIFVDSPELSRQAALSIQQTVTQSINAFMESLGRVITDSPVLFLEIFVTLFVTFYFLRDGKKIVKGIYNILPFEGKIKDKFLKRSKEIANATIFGQIIIGLIQGVAAGISFYLFGAPSPLFFTILAIFLAILPFVGAWLVWFPVGLVMIATGNVVNGVLLMVYGIVVVGLIDDFVRPHIVGKRGKINPAIALVGMLGGLALIGPVGLIVGPLIIEYVLIFIQLYKKRKLSFN
jgi:predicted PurR-regulated permease PerM